MKNIFYSLFSLIFFQGIAQNEKIDSLKTLLYKNNEDTGQVAILINLCRENRKIGEFDKALQYGKDALSLGNKIANTSPNTNKVQVTKNYIADAHNNIGIISWNQGNYDKAFEEYFASIKIRENVIAQATKTNNLKLLKSAKKGLSASYNNMGLVFESQNKSNKAIENYTISLKIQEEILDKQGLANTYNNIGVIYYNQENYDKALENYLVAKNIYIEIKDKQGVSSVLSNVGVVYKYLNKYDKALENYLIALKIREEINDKIGVANSYSNIGNLYFAQNKTTEAKKYFLKSLELSKKLGSKNEIMTTYQNLTMCDSTVGNYKEALYYYKLFKQFNDSIFNEEGLEKSIEMGIRFETEKKEAQIKLLEKEKEKQAAVSIAEKKQQKAILFFIVIILFLVIVFSIFMYNRYRITQKQKSQIEEQKKITEQQKILVEEKNKEITDSIQYAKRIQSAILPSQKVVKEYLPESFIIYKPKDIVAGDFYWMESVTVIANKERVKQSVNNEKIASSESLRSQNRNDVILFAAADCTGHGVPGAMVSVVCNNGLNRSVREYGLTDSGEILNKTREIVLQEFEKSDEDVKDGMDIALCSLEFTRPNVPFRNGLEVKSLEFDKEQHGTQNSNRACELNEAKLETAALLQYAGANNPLWIIRPSVIASATKQSLQNEQIASLSKAVHNDGNFELIETTANKQPIGKFDNPEPYTTHTFELQKGDSIYIFSDGYADQFGGEKGKKFKAKAFKNLLLNIQDKSMEQQRILIDAAFENWKGNIEQVDDVCVIGVRI